MVTYEDFSELFAGITKMWLLTPAELEDEGSKLLELFKDHLQPSVTDELLHIKSHLLTSNIEDRKPVSLLK